MEQEIEKVKDLVYNTKTTCMYGFKPKEIEELLKNFPNIKRGDFNRALGVNTCMMHDGEIVTYHSDIELALITLIEDREKHLYEWD